MGGLLPRRALAQLSRRGTRSASSRGPVIAVHGGAWAIPDDLRQASLDGVAVATESGWERLLAGGSAVDAVEAAVRSLEEDPAFDAGRGAVLTSQGSVELDAVIMDGRDLDAGAVAALGPVLHPVSVARLVMERSPHALLCGAGATAFACEHGVPLLAADDLVTAAARKEYEAMAAYPTSVDVLFNARAARQGGHDTVGAVAVDAEGNVAAATSTGGITFKRPGRVGDSPIIGGGCLADNAAGAISTTGHGESLMRYTLASRCLASIERDGSAPDAALAAALAGMLDRLRGCGGAVCLDAAGAPGIAFSTERMAWGFRDASSGGVRHGVDRADAAAAGAEAVFVVDPAKADVWAGSSY